MNLLLWSAEFFSLQRPDNGQRCCPRKAGTSFQHDRSTFSFQHDKPEVIPYKKLLEAGPKQEVTTINVLFKHALKEQYSYS